MNKTIKELVRGDVFVDARHITREVIWTPVYDYKTGICKLSVQRLYSPTLNMRCHKSIIRRNAGEIVNCIQSKEKLEMGNKSPSKVEPMDNRDLTSAILKLTDRIEKLEAPSKEDDMKSAGRFRAYKEEIREMLVKHNEERAAQRKDFEEHFNVIGQHINMVLPGLNRLENRVNAIWNTFNAFVRFVEKLVLLPTSVDQGVDVHGQTVTATNFLHPKWPTSREEFQQEFMAAGKEVFTEHQDHEKSELERLRREKKEHGVALTPAKAHTDGPDSVMLEMNNMVIDHVQKNRGDIQERIELDAEARKKLTDALATHKEAYTSGLVETKDP